MSLENSSDLRGYIPTRDVPPVAPASCITHLQAFSASMRDGSPQAALEAASEACRASPNRPEPHYAQGQAWAALGDPARAEQAFAAAIRIAPAWADAWINFGLCRYRQGAIEDAKTAMRNALRHAPNNRAAATNLGAFMRLTICFVALGRKCSSTRHGS